MTTLPPEIKISGASSTDDSPSSPSDDDNQIPPRSQPIHTNPPTDLDLANLDTLARGSDYENVGHLLRIKEIHHEDRSTYSFWSLPLVNKIVTRARILEELKEYQDNHHELREESLPTLADEIYMEYRTTFAILCIIDKSYCILDFINEGVKDADLPLIPCLGSDPTNYVFARKESPSKQLHCLKRWKGRHDRESFGRMQHRFLPAFLDLEIDPASGRRNIRHEPFKSTIVLPIQGREDMNQGGYGVVSRVRIHPHCHNFRNILRPVRPVCSLSSSITDKIVP